jgi:tetratricopeptide (TPR) repeat protein
LARISRGIAAIQLGRPAEGARMLDESLTAFSKTGHGVWIWYLRAVQAEGLAMAGELERALALVDENLALIENGEDRVYHAEVLRIRGSLLAKQGKLEEAELSLRNAIDVARTQKAKSWELRAATELARLLADRHERSEAYVLLAGVYEWFEQLGQGLATKDLIEAKALMETLKG